ncbi:MAG: hypothetical protein ACI36V_03090 [Coriobacteriales bacterium]
MAGEDPGVGTFSVILELVKQAGGAVSGTVKNTIGFVLDVIKTGMFFSWRRQMMNAQKGPDLEHGQQSIRELRLHEQVGAQIVSVEIGDFKSMDALSQELRRLAIDFAITEHDHQYTLHYKSNNEPDVMLAQAAAMQRLYGDPSKVAEELEAEQARQNQQREQQVQDQQAQQQQQDDQLREQQQGTASAPAQDKGEERADRADSTGTDKAERTASQPLVVAGAAKAVPVDELQQKLGEFASRQQVRMPEQGREAAPSRHASVDELKKYAMERAQRKNLSRQQVRKQSRERSLGKSMARSRNRGLELGH